MLRNSGFFVVALNFCNGCKCPLFCHQNTSIHLKTEKKIRFQNKWIDFSKYSCLSNVNAHIRHHLHHYYQFISLSIPSDLSKSIVLVNKINIQHYVMIISSEMNRQTNKLYIWTLKIITIWYNMHEYLTVADIYIQKTKKTLWQKETRNEHTKYKKKTNKYPKWWRKKEYKRAKCFDWRDEILSKKHKQLPKYRSITN